jgi:hypothetical protein
MESRVAKSHVSLAVPQSRGLPPTQSLGLSEVGKSKLCSRAEPSLSYVGRAVGGKAAQAAFEGAAPTDRAAPAPVSGGVSETSAVVVVASVTESNIKKEKAKAMVNKALQSRVLVALVVFVFTVVLLFVINPPMAQQPSDKDGKAKRSWRKIAVWSTISGLLALILPYAACLVKKDA